MAKPTVLAERLRCKKLVEEYRLKLQASVSRARSSPFGMVTVAGCLIEKGAAIKIADAICQSLESIERDIESNRLARKRRDDTGDFSLDEMALAESIIAEQDHNPFEG